MLRNPRFLLLALSTAFVGATVGVERSVLALLGEQKFHLASQTAIASFLLGFGASKALANLFTGPLMSRFGAGRVLVAGWGIGLFVPMIIIAAPTWSWVVGANLLLGISQGLCWSVALVQMVEIAGDRRRGTGAGLNEFAGYLAAAAGAVLATRFVGGTSIGKAPFLLMQALAFAGLLTSLAVARSSRRRAMPSRPDTAAPGFGRLFRRLSFTDRATASLSAAGLVTNLSDALAWALLPVFFARQGLSLSRIGVLAAVYPAVWAVAQLGTGWGSDHLGRPKVIVAGLTLQAASVAALTLADSFGGWLACMVGLGLGTAAVYPTAVAAVADLVPSSERPASIGIYRLWRDLGYVVGALIAGAVADLAGFEAAIAAVASVTAAVAFLNRISLSCEMQRSSAMVRL